MPQDLVTVAASVERFIRKRFAIEDDEPGFAQDVHLWEEGFVDSIGLVDVINFLEGEFDVKIPDSALADASNGSILGLSALIIKLKET